MMDYSRYGENLRVSFDDHILTIALANPPMNCNTDAMHKALSQIWEDIHDDDDVNVVILTGEGRVFSAGGDVKHMQFTVDNPHTWWQTVSEARRASAVEASSSRISRTAAANARLAWVFPTALSTSDW